MGSWPQSKGSAMNGQTGHFNEDENPVGCPMCGGTPALLGTLGNLTWLRCTGCGSEYSVDADYFNELVDEDLEDENA